MTARKKIVAVIGSSGGGTATLGHTETESLLQTLHHQLQQIEVDSKCGSVVLGQALMVSLHHGKGMDGAQPDVDMASLYQVWEAATAPASSQLSCRAVLTGTLREVNAECQRLERNVLAAAIQEGEIHALVCISCSVDVFAHTLEEAANHQIPVTGSGGTSISQAAAHYKLALLGNAGGSVATTSYTRAVSYTHALASHWKFTYQPWKHKENQNQHTPSLRSVLNATLPAFWGVCLTKILARYVLSLLDATQEDASSYWAWLGPVVSLLDLRSGVKGLLYVLENWALPTACAVIIATSYQEALCSWSYSSSMSGASISEQQQMGPTSSLIMAAVIASTACYRSIWSGLVAGRLVVMWTERLLYWCIFRQVPATMTNLLTAGGVGGFTALFLLPVAPILRSDTSALRRVLLWTVTLSGVSNSSMWRLVTAFGWGCWSCYSSKIGWYHAVHLPLILIEMELGDASFLGAVDELTLVLVCAGICAGNLFVHMVSRRPPGEFDTVLVSDADAALCRRGLRTNFMCGDFIEACYPYMERHPLVNLGGYLASGLSTACLVAALPSGDDGNDDGLALWHQVPKSLAYLPLPASILLAGNQWYRMALASAIAMGVSFLATVINFFWVLLSTKEKVR